MMPVEGRPVLIEELMLLETDRLVLRLVLVLVLIEELMLLLIERLTLFDILLLALMLDEMDLDMLLLTERDRPRLFDIDGLILGLGLRQGEGEMLLPGLIKG